MMKNTFFLPNILIVDDTEENLFLLQEIISQVNVNMIMALSGSEALEKTRGIELALAILDVQMPVMDGFELAVKLNEERFDDKIPILFLTASNSNEINEYKGYGSGAVDFIYKPINIPVLQSKIKVFLDLYNQKQTIVSKAIQLKKNADELTRMNLSLKKSKKRLKDVLFSMADWMWEIDENGIYTHCSEHVSDILGYTQTEVVGKTPFDFMSPDEGKRVAVLFSELAANKLPIKDLENWNMRKDGKKICLLSNGVPIFDKDGNLKGYRGVDRDITQQIYLEESLRTNQIELEMQNEELKQAKDIAETSSQKYTELYNVAPSGFFTLSSDGEILELNYSGSLMLGMSKVRSRLVDNRFDSYISKDTLPIFNDFWGKVFQSKNKETCEIVLETEDFPPRFVQIEGVVPANGKHCILIVVDITERKHADQAIKISEEKYRTMLNASPDGILLIDLNGIITEASEIGLELFGTGSKDELIGKNFNHFVPSDEINVAVEMFEKTMNEGLAQNIGLKIRKKNQFLFFSEISSTLIQALDGKPLSFMLIIRDISQRKKTETKKLHADRMANLGEMASGMAHEINQPLNIISMVMDKILFETAKTETINIEFLKDKSDKIFENIIRIRNIIDHVRAFSRNDENYVLAAFNINGSIGNAISMITEQFKHLGIRLNLNLNEQIPSVFGNTYKFEQVIVNLLANAKDAVIEKKSKQKEFSDMEVGINTYQENQFMIVEITDNGIGIHEDDIRDIMLPFYTTKEEGKGTGLGLSISYQIIQEMNGTIEITSNPLVGTKIKLVFDLQNEKLR